MKVAVTQLPVGIFVTRDGLHLHVGCKEIVTTVGPMLEALIEEHARVTGSERAERILATWEVQLRKFVKVMPRDYKRVLQAIAEAERDGADVDEAIMAACRG